MTPNYSFAFFFLKGCPNNYYKNDIGNKNCKKCPDGKTNNTMHTECTTCKKDYYVEDNNDGDNKCYGMYAYKFLTFVTDSLDQRIKNAYCISFEILSWSVGNHRCTPLKLVFFSFFLSRSAKS